MQCLNQRTPSKYLLEGMEGEGEGGMKRAKEKGGKAKGGREGARKRGRREELHLVVSCPSSHPQLGVS